MLDLIRRPLALILCLAGWCGGAALAQDSERRLARIEDSVLVEILTVEDFFGDIKRVPADLVGWADEAEGELRFGVAELVIGENDRHHIEIIGLSEGREVIGDLRLADGGMSFEPAAGATSAEIGDLMINNFSEWCGRWRRGIGGRVWRLCTGNDCRRTGDPIFQPMICIQRRLPNL